MIDEQFYQLATHLWRGGSYAYYWTPADGGDISEWFPVDNVVPVPDLWKFNTYFGVHPSKQLKSKHQRTTLEDVSAVNCLFAEFDLAEGQAKDHLLESIYQIDVAPSMIVFSGGGYHCYWLLDSTYNVHSHAELEEIKAIQYAWVELVGSDGAAKDLTRVLRVPGSRNVKPKYAPKYPTVEIVKFDLDLTYELADLRQHAEQYITKPTQINTAAPVNVPVDIQERIDRMLREDAGAAALFNGDMSTAGGDASKADLALCNNLSFWFGRDKQTIDLVFRQSKLYREKWEREDYREKTLNKAISGTTKVFDPSSFYAAQNGNPQSLVGVLPSSISTAHTNGNGYHAQPTQTSTASTNGATATNTAQSTQSPQSTPVTHVTAGKGKRGNSADIIKVLTSLGYSFRTSELENTIEVNGKQIDDQLAAEIRNAMRDEGFSDMRAIEDAYTAQSRKQGYHPIKEYLEGLRWDGADWIAILAAQFKDSHSKITYSDGLQRTVTHAWLWRWMIGAVGKVYTQAQNPMLVLDGPQGLGKSHFVSWLGSEVRPYAIESPIKPEDKDHDRFLVNRWIWEAAELGSTTRKADIEALKAFITKRDVTVRKQYDKHAITKPAMASFVGTINNEVGFLVDTTGNRRYLSVNLLSIDHDYIKIIPVSQLWAQAFELWKADPDSYKLTPEETEVRNAINATYQMEDPTGSWIEKYYEIDIDQTTWRSTTQEITSVLQDKGYKGDTKSIQMAVAKALKAMGLKQDANARPRQWRGIKQRSWTATP